MEAKHTKKSFVGKAPVEYVNAFKRWLWLYLPIISFCQAKPLLKGSLPKIGAAANQLFVSDGSHTKFLCLFGQSVSPPALWVKQT